MQVTEPAVHLEFFLCAKDLELVAMASDQSPEQLEPLIPTDPHGIFGAPPSLDDCGRLLRQARPPHPTQRTAWCARPA